MGTKTRTWHVATLADRLVGETPEAEIKQWQTIPTRVGSVDANSREEAEAKATARWPGKKLSITRGSQG